jgi:transcriptional regulator with XRE-family HTH domain
MALTAQQLRELMARTPVSGNRLAHAIELAGITQTALAAAIGLPNTYISDTARGRYQTITVENAHRFAEYFGVSIDVLFPSKEAA